MTIENNILKVLVEGFVSPILQNGDIDKITTKTNGRCESGRHFSVEYRHHLGPRADGIVGKTYQTYNSLPPCQEIVISRHKLSQNDNFMSKYPSSAAAILKPRFQDHVTPIPAGPDFGPVIWLGLDLIIVTKFGHRHLAVATPFSRPHLTPNLEVAPNSELALESSWASTC